MTHSSQGTKPSQLYPALASNTAWCVLAIRISDRFEGLRREGACQRVF
jgi:hypothetical protein